MSSSSTTRIEKEKLPTPLNVALLGAGIFASTAHAPILQKHPEIFHCVAVYSRRIEVASKLASTLSSSSSSTEVTPYADIEKVIQIPNLDAVIMALPLDVQPQYIPMCLKAGLHILSEKPIGPNVDVGKKLLKEYQSILKDSNNDKKKHLVWSVAENYRYEPALTHAAQILTSPQKEIGKPFMFTLNIRSPFLPNNKYLKTPWRNQPTWGDGGLFIDAFVHASAMLRMMFPSGSSRTKVSAVTSSHAEHIPGLDTMVANVEYENSNDGDGSITGSISATYACSTMAFAFEVIGTNGSLLLSRNTDKPGYHLKVESVKDEGGGKNLWEKDFDFGGIEQEFLAFAASCQQRNDDVNTPLEAFKDLMFVEACLDSGTKNGEIVIFSDDGTLN